MSPSNPPSGRSVKTYGKNEVPQLNVKVESDGKEIVIEGEGRGVGSEGQTAISDVYALKQNKLEKRKSLSILGS